MLQMDKLTLALSLEFSSPWLNKYYTPVMCQQFLSHLKKGLIDHYYEEKWVFNHNPSSIKKYNGCAMIINY